MNYFPTCGNQNPMFTCSCKITFNVIGSLYKVESHIPLTFSSWCVPTGFLILCGFAWSTFGSGSPQWCAAGWLCPRHPCWLIHSAILWSAWLEKVYLSHWTVLKQYSIYWYSICSVHKYNFSVSLQGICGYSRGEVVRDVHHSEEYSSQTGWRDAETGNCPNA